MPTRAPSLFKAKAKLTATVDFPTPPLAEETAKIFLTEAIGLTPSLTR